MKKAFSLFLCLLIVLFSACGQSEAPSASAPTPTVVPTAAPTPSPTTTPDTDELPATVEVDENLLDVDVTLPPDFFDGEDMSAFVPNTYAEEMGFKKAVLHDDGSVTVTMTKAFHKEFMKELALSLEEAFAEVGPVNNVSCIQEVKHNENFTEITVVVDRALYEANGTGLSTLAILVLASYYIAFDGNTGANITVNTVDVETGELLNSYNTSQLAE